MPRKRNRQRGPRFIPVRPVRLTPRYRVMMPKLLGLVVRLAREGVGATQQDVALHLGLPISSVSKLERGDITMTAYHLDAFAAAFSHFEEEEDPEADGWEGWELLKVASEIADAIDNDEDDEEADEDEEPIAVYWAAPKKESEGDGVIYIKGRRLRELVLEEWPEEFEGRLAEE